MGEDIARLKFLRSNGSFEVYIDASRSMIDCVGKGGSVYLDEPGLNRHKDVVHRKKKNYLKGPQTIYRCNKCDYSTVKKHNLQRHMYIKHGARRHKGNLETQQEKQ